MGWIADIIKELPLSVNLQSQLEELDKKFTITERERNDFKSKLDDADKEIARLNKIIQSFQEHQGEKCERGRCVKGDAVRLLGSKESTL